MKAIISPVLTLPEDWYARPTLKVAKDLLGCYLHHRLPSGIVFSAQINEVEAYTADDPACHAFKGQTKRTEIMFGPACRSYVYFIYGMYHCLNVVTEPDGIPGAVLIRGVNSLSPSGAKLNGPGKLCKYWQIDREHNGLNLMDSSSPLWITKRPSDSKPKILISTRIGISQAQDKQWRFYI